MAIARDRSDLPAPGAFPADRHLRFLGPAFDRWYDDWATKRAEHESSGSRFSASRAANCLRAVAYYDAQTPIDDEPDIADAWRFTIGDLVHDFAQQYLQLVFPGCTVEVRQPLRGIPSSVGIADVVIDGTIDELAPHLIGTPDLAARELDGLDIDMESGRPWRVCMELKSASGYPFKAATTNFGKAPPEGPKIGHSFQGALCAEANDADEMIVGWVALENLSKTWNGLNPDLGGRDRFLAEWTYNWDEYREIAKLERQRIVWLQRFVDDNVVDQAVVDADDDVDRDEVLASEQVVELRRRVAHRVPMLILTDDTTPATIVNPSDGSAEVVGTGGTILAKFKWWGCNYCDYQRRCVDEHAGRVHVPAER